MLGQNETGVLQPVAELAAICAERGFPLAHRRRPGRRQAAGRFPRARRRDDDRRRAQISRPTRHRRTGRATRHRTSTAALGGFQQGGLRPGTESRRARRRHVPRARTVARRASRNAPLGCVNFAIVSSERFSPDGPLRSVIGGGAERLPHTSNIAFVGLDRQALFMALDQAGVACSTGSACASGSSEPSPVLVAMGLRNGRHRERLAVQFGRHDDGRRRRRSGSSHPPLLQRLAAAKTSLKFACERLPLGETNRVEFGVVKSASQLCAFC